jgi:hypothetical protein
LSPTAPGAEDAERALDRLRVLSPVQAIRDPALNMALGPFRGHAPIALVCANASCSEPFVVCSLDATTARVRFDEHAAESIAAPGDPLLRWRFYCPRCDRTCVLSNDRMIALILRALASGRTSIRPAAE